MLYLLVFYTCLSVFYSFAHFKDYAGQSAFMPFWVLSLDLNAWNKDSFLWIFSAGFQLVPIALFIYLHRSRLEGLAGPAAPLRPAPAT